MKGPGKLLAWKLYSVSNATWPRIPIRLQLWETVRDREATFRLVYETKHNLTSAERGLVTVSIDLT